MVTNYQRGYQVERRAFKELEEQGYYPIRASGSHTLFDIVAIPLRNKKLIKEIPKVKLIQLKRVKGKYYSFKKELKEMWAVKIFPFAQKELWVRLDRMKGRKSHWKKTVLIE